MKNVKNSPLAMRFSVSGTAERASFWGGENSENS